MTSWATSMTATPVGADLGRPARRPRPGWAGRGCRGARRAAAARGRCTSAWAISSRCCSPPETCADGTVRIGRWRRPARSTSATRAALGTAPGSSAGRGSGRPQRSPSRPRRTTSTPRMRRPGRSCGAAAGSRCAGWPRPAARPSTRSSPPASGHQPEDGLDQGRLAHAVGAEHGHELAGPDRQVDVAPDGAPADLAPPTTGRRRRRPVGRTAVGRGSVGRVHRVSSLRCAWARALARAPELGRLPVPGRSAGRHQRLGDGRDRDVVRLGLVGRASGCRAWRSGC